MAEDSDMDLMRAYADRQSEPAFAELVRRHVNLVYSVALRHTRNAPDAQDATQAVFIILARKAAGLRHRTTLTGWLYETTRFTVRQLLRTRARQQVREQEAYVQSTLNETETGGVWRQLEPLLEDAMSRLSEKERTLLALRFFENKTGAEAAILLGIQEGAAHKRAERALEKLRKFFARRGLATTAALIAGAMSAHSVQAAPAAFTPALTALALAKGATAGGSTLTLIKGALKLMAWTKAKTALIAGACVLLTAGTTTVILCNRDQTFQGIPQEWSYLSGNGDQWHWTNNAIHGHTTTGDSILASTRQYGDVTLSAMASTTNREASLALRFQDAGNGYLAVFVPDHTPGSGPDGSRIVLIRRLSGEEKELVMFKRREIAGPGQLEKLTFSARGRQLEVRLNDITIIKTNDWTFTSGFIGLRVYGDTTIPCDATFSNLTVH